MNSAYLKKIIDCGGEDIHGYLPRTLSGCLHVEESRKEWKTKGKKVRCEQVQITLKTRYRQQNDIPQIDFFSNIWGFCIFRDRNLSLKLFSPRESRSLQSV